MSDLHHRRMHYEWLPRVMWRAWARNAAMTARVSRNCNIRRHKVGEDMSVVENIELLPFSFCFLWAISWYSFSWYSTPLFSLLISIQQATGLASKRQSQADTWYLSCAMLLGLLSASLYAPTDPRCVCICLASSIQSLPLELNRKSHVRIVN